VPAQSYQSEVSISLKEAYQGTTRRIEVDGRRLEVTIPAGARSGTRIRVADAVSSPNGSKGDLFLVIEVADDPKFDAKATIYIPTWRSIYPKQCWEAR